MSRLPYPNPASSSDSSATRRGAPPSRPAPTAFLLRALACSLAALSSSCGGQTASDTPADVDSEGSDEGQGFDPGSDELVEQSEPKAPEDACAGGTCFHCGEEAVCLEGFFCDEGASACGWVPECARETSCECLQEKLSGCTCTERDGGFFVQCASQ